MGGFLLAHHWPGQLDRCYLVWLGGRPVWFCARCIGVYPALFGVLAGLLLWEIPAGWWDLPWLFLLVVPAVLDWALARLGFREGTNRSRTITGAMLGVSLGRTIYLNLVHPFNFLVMVQLAVLVGAVVLFELVAGVGAGRGRPERKELEQ